MNKYKVKISPSNVIMRFVVLIIVVILLPIYTLISLLIIVLSGKPVFYKQKRVGYKGKIFDIYKFRTMYIGAENDRDSLLEENEANGPVFKIADDPRFTKIGRFLSHSGLDELPQFVNVIKGEMSIIGPRPLPVYEAKKIEKKYRRREDVLPGIISPWIFDGYHKLTFDEWMKSDLHYVKNRNLFYDLNLISKAFVLFIKLIFREIFDTLT